MKCATWCSTTTPSKMPPTRRPPPSATRPTCCSHRYGFGCQPEGDAVLEDAVFLYLDLDAAWIAKADVRAPGLFNAARQALG